MKKLLLVLTLFVSLSLYSQSYNTNLLGHLNLATIHGTELSDIWGYTDETGKEYAIIGCNNGTSIVDVSDPTNPIEIHWQPGMNSIWRDIKTFGDYAYVTTEALQGLLILDLTSLPDPSGITASYFYGPAMNQWQSAHNLYIDEFGFMYIAGANRGNGGVIIYDLNTFPLNPTEVGQVDFWYAHDAYAQDNIGYFSHILDGYFSIFDLTDKSNPIFLGSSITPSVFTHNLWTDETNQYAFTTDEVEGGFLGAYDVSDRTNPVFIDKIQSSPGSNVIPHNVHVKGDFLYTSYYRDGLVIHDISNPHNMVEVGKYDTSPLSGGGFNGCWGVYPFLESGIILAADIELGLFVIGENVPYGSYLEGNITEFGTDFPVGNVEISIDGTLITDYSNVIGDYATGINHNGSLDVTYFKVLYYPQTISIDFQEGVTVIQDVVLNKIPQFSINVIVYDEDTNLPIEDAIVNFEHTYITHEENTNSSGETLVELVYVDNYQIYVGKWGYITECYTDFFVDGSTGTIEVYLKKGIYDDFALDFGWTATSTASRGDWVRDKPVGVIHNGITQNPMQDIGYDCGKKAYITGNGTTASNTQEVNDGEVELFSPIMDLTSYSNPHVNYTVWYFNMYGPSLPNDTLKIYMSNGTNKVLIDYYDPETTPMSLWLGNSVSLSDKITITSTMQLSVYISDFLETENITEAAFDFFSVTNFSVLSQDKNENINEIMIYPNPFNDEINFSEKVEYFELRDLSGKLIYSGYQTLNFQINLNAGFYLISLFDENKHIIKTEKLVKY